MSTSGGSSGGGGGDRLPVGDPTGLTTLDTYINPLNPTPDIPVTAAVYVPTTGDGSPLDVAYAWQLEGDAFPRVVVLTNGSQYFGDGTSDPVKANPAEATAIFVNLFGPNSIGFAAPTMAFFSANPINFPGPISATDITAQQSLTSGGVFNNGTVTTAGRPDPMTVAIGAQFYDTDLLLPIWSNGTDWTNALGVPV